MEPHWLAHAVGLVWLGRFKSSGGRVWYNYPIIQLQQTSSGGERNKSTTVNKTLLEELHREEIERPDDLGRDNLYRVYFGVYRNKQPAPM